MRTVFLALERPKEQPPAAEASAWCKIGCCLAYARVLRERAGAHFVRQCPFPASVVGSAYYVAPESRRVSRLRLVTENSAFRGARCAATSARGQHVHRAKRHAERRKNTAARLERLASAFGTGVLPQFQQRKIHQACVGSVKYPNNNRRRLEAASAPPNKSLAADPAPFIGPGLKPLGYISRRTVEASARSGAGSAE
jgi:hypothetical protein